MEVPKGYISKVKLPVPVNTDVVVTITKATGPLTPFTVTPTAGEAEVNLPYAATHTEGRLKVEVQFDVDADSYTNSTYVDVVTPYVSLSKIKSILGPEATDEECFLAEAAARHIINAHTGQTFGYYEGTHEVMSNYDEALPLPSKVIRIDTISEGPYVKFDRANTTGTSFQGEGQFIITGSGWFIKRPEWASGIYSGDYYSSDPITYYDSYSDKKFRNDIAYFITGAFGYEQVPLAVVQAAEILTNDYACADSEYRERYLDSIKSADWRLEFNSGAFRRTGNARADKLLSPFVIYRAKVI